ncbi:TetR family transcriptional regulator [Amycolatopsis sp. SB7-3]|uniref:TetR family transcriptional regulator n=1 Tax=Amycolatopsis sp. SB7-3 TaxID=3373438 RepID=UPI0037423FC6
MRVASVARFFLVAAFAELAVSDGRHACDFTITKVLCFSSSQAGVAIGSIYQHFPGKAELFRSEAERCQQLLAGTRPRSDAAVRPAADVAQSPAAAAPTLPRRQIVVLPGGTRVRR